MKINFSFFLVVLLCMATNSQGQKRSKKNQPDYPPVENQWWIKVNPLNIMEPEVPVAATVQFSRNPAWAYALDMGVFVARHYSGTNNNFAQMGGYRFKPEIKYCINQRRRNGVATFVTLQGLIKRTSIRKQNWFTHFDNNGQYLYNELVDYKENKMVTGASLLFETEFYADDKGKWVINFFFGFGVRNKTFSTAGMPPGISVDFISSNTRSWFNLDKNGSFPSMPFGFKVGYRIK